MNFDDNKGCDDKGILRNQQDSKFCGPAARHRIRGLVHF